MAAGSQTRDGVVAHSWGQRGGNVAAGSETRNGVVAGCKPATTWESTWELSNVAAGSETRNGVVAGCKPATTWELTWMQRGQTFALASHAAYFLNFYFLII